MRKIERFDKTLKLFLEEYIRTLPRGPFKHPRDYQTMFMLMFRGWALLKQHPAYSPSRVHRLEKLMKMIDQFDNGITRPIEVNSLRGSQFSFGWMQIYNESRRVS